MSTFLLDGFTTYKSRLVLTVISSNDKVYTSVNTNDITDVRNITFFDIAGYGDMQKILAMLIYKPGSSKLIDVVVKVFCHAFSEIGQLNTSIQCIY